ncbi:hypothetical protein RclHR1_08770007 [Rhizophagus clarus]|uniref:Telomere repeat-binding factor dimerisation domain-containing protein n=1 Tax=Rhizophagus clarus TaxID=94130 RepID=A0A2Z6S1U2_9GLOM|nr:hypothetical protein RclHR1_08770007 [Rhizophagus clarus]GES76237.1 hypothetical protein GLOIN_2v1507326 [Rhizophagus clarus]
MTAETPESLIITAIIVKDDELLRHLHILDTLAYESLTAQLKYFEKKIMRNQEPSVILNLKRIASKKYMCFFEVKKSLLKSSDFIDINKFEISKKNEVFNTVIRSNVTHFFNLLFTNFDPAVPDLQKVDIESFFNYVVPTNLKQSEEIWDLYLKLRVQIYISIINKNPQKKFYNVMFPKDVVEGPPKYKETYLKVRKIIKRSPEDVEKLMQEFKWEKFVEGIIDYLSNITNELEMPLLYKCISIKASPISSSPISSSPSSPIRVASRNENDNNSKKRRITDVEEYESISSDSLDDYSTILKRRNLSLIIDN